MRTRSSFASSYGAHRPARPSQPRRLLIADSRPPRTPCAGAFLASKSDMITGFAPRISRNDLIRLSVFFLRIASIGAAVLYAFATR